MNEAQPTNGKRRLLLFAAFVIGCALLAFRPQLAGELVQLIRLFLEARP